MNAAEQVRAAMRAAGLVCQGPFVAGGRLTASVQKLRRRPAQRMVRSPSGSARCGRIWLLEAWHQRNMVRAAGHKLFER